MSDTSESPLSIVRASINTSGVTARELLIASTKAKIALGKKKGIDVELPETIRIGRCYEVLSEILWTALTIGTERFQGVNVKTRMTALGLTYDHKTDWPLAVLARCITAINSDYKDLELARKHRNRWISRLYETIGERLTLTLLFDEGTSHSAALLKAISIELETEHAMFGTWNLKLVAPRRVYARITGEEEVVTLDLNTVEMTHVPEINTWTLKREEREFCEHEITIMTMRRQQLANEAIRKMRPLSDSIIALRTRLAEKAG